MARLFDSPLRLRVRQGAAVALLMLLAGARGAAASPWLYGIHFYGDPAASHAEQMSGGKPLWSLECVLTDSDVWWGAVWQRDNRFNHMRARGHTIIARIQPQWGYAVPREPTYTMADYLVKVQAAAYELRNVCHIWQVGNEMNLFAEYGGGVLTAAEYVNKFKQIRAAIKSVTSPLGPQIVLLGPVSPGPPAGGVRHTDGNVYLAQMCAALTSADLDGFGIHAYGAPWLGAADARKDLQAGYISQLCIVDHYGFSHLPVYMTEWNRATNPNSAADEAQTARFLHGAFADLAAWNQRPRAHPIGAACWFIYAFDSTTWAQYSIEYLRTVNPPGPNNDLFDAFAFAAASNYPSVSPPPGGIPPRVTGGVPPGVNVALTATATADSALTPASRAIDGVISAGSKWTSDSVTPLHWLQLDLGSIRAVSGFVVYHAGAGGESTSYNTQCFMFETAPTAGGPWTIEGSFWNQLNFTARTLLAPRFVRHVRLFIADPGIDNHARIPEFQVYAVTPGDLDQDGDRDLADAAAFQRCFTGAGGGPTGAGCLAAQFDEDGDVDAQDWASFGAGLTGP